MTRKGIRIKIRAIEYAVATLEREKKHLRKELAGLDEQARLRKLAREAKQAIHTIAT